MGRADTSAGRQFVLDQPGGNLALDLFVLHQHLGSFLETAFAGTGVTPSQYAVYSQLGDRELTPRQLERTLGMRPATLSGYLATMERRGHLARRPNETDGRSHILALTPAGRLTCQQCRRRMGEAVRALNAEVGSDPEVAALRLALGDLDAAIQAAVAKVDHSS